MIIAVVNTKGGVGKTTTAVHLAAAFATQGTALLIDGDPQASAASWAAWRREADRRPSPTTIVLAGKAILDEGRALATRYDNTVIDAGGRDSPGMRAALLLADQAIVPIGASNLDAAALDDLVAIIEAARVINDHLRVRVLLTRVDPRTKDTADMLSHLEAQKLEVLRTRICERVSVRRAVGDGATVAEIKADPNAISEFKSFFEEIQHA